MMRVTVVTLVALAALAGKARAQRVEAGVVDSLAGLPDGLRAYRSGKWETLTRLAPLYADDSIVAVKVGTLAALRLYGRGVQWVCTDPRARPACTISLTIRRPVRSGGLGVAVRALIQRALEPILGGEQWSRNVTTIGRGDDDIVVPLLGAAPEVGADNRQLEVAWAGGKPPFTVQLVKDGVGAVRGVAEVAGQSASLGKFALIPGEYGLRIADARGTSRLTRFRVVEVKDLPSPPPEYDMSGLSGGTRTLLGALWLAGLEDGRWAWEAYLRLLALPGDETARRIRVQLASGRLPPKQE